MIDGFQRDNLCRSGNLRELGRISCNGCRYRLPVDPPVLRTVCVLGPTGKPHNRQDR